MSGGWPPMSRRALRCSSPRSAGTSRNPRSVQLFREPIQWIDEPVILVWPLINGSPGRNILIRWERKRHRGWDHSWTGEAVSPLWMMFCYISSSSVPWWTMRAPSGDPPLAPILRNCRCCSLRIATNAPWYIGNRQIHHDSGVPYSSDHIRSLIDSTRS